MSRGELNTLDSGGSSLSLERWSSWNGVGRSTDFGRINIWMFAFRKYILKIVEHLHRIFHLFYISLAGGVCSY